MKHVSAASWFCRKGREGLLQVGHGFEGKAQPGPIGPAPTSQAGTPGTLCYRTGSQEASLVQGSRSPRVDEQTHSVLSQHLRPLSELSKPT